MTINCRDYNDEFKNKIELGDIQIKDHLSYSPYKSREISNLEVELPYIKGLISKGDHIDKDHKILMLYIGAQTKTDIETIYSDLATLAGAENGNTLIIKGYFEPTITKSTKYYRADGSLTNPPDGYCPMKVTVRFTEINWRCGTHWSQGHGCFIISEVTKVILHNKIERFWIDELPKRRSDIDYSKRGSGIYSGGDASWDNGRISSWASWGRY